MPFMPFNSWNRLEIDFETEARGCVSFPLGGVRACLLSARLGYFCALRYVCVSPWLCSLRQVEGIPSFQSWAEGEEMTDNKM